MRLAWRSKVQGSIPASRKPKSSAGGPRESVLAAMPAGRPIAIVHSDRTTRFREETMMEPTPTLFLDDEPVESLRSEELLIQSWRAEQLQRLGLSNLLSELFAGLVDWHEIAELVARGCPPLLAVEIVR